ncbi:hypothetical protein JJD66_26140 [Pseudomonas sp. MF6751]|nr:hypothetical protein [Pseudomonas sp. MF6751]
MTELNDGALFDAEFGIGHRGSTVPERSGVALSFRGRRDKYLARGPIDEGFIPYRFPISNIRTDASVMTGHDDIWNDTMSNFIYQLMLVIVERPMAMPVPIE